MSSAAGDESTDHVDPIAVVEAWRTGLACFADPVTLAVVQALARRAAAQDGAAKRWMLRRIQALMAMPPMRERSEQEEAAPAEMSSALPATKPAGVPTQHALADLSQLVDRLGRTTFTSAATPTPSRAAPAPADHRSKKTSPVPAMVAATPRPLKSVTAFKGTWSRLRAEQRLRQVLAQVPPMAGPLNSAHVVNRALQAMRDLSPQYLDAFILHVDALLWLEQSSGGDLMPRAMATSDDRHRPAERRPRKA